jgi:hypothetical protein
MGWNPFTNLLGFCVKIQSFVRGVVETTRGKVFAKELVEGADLA